MPTTGYHRAAAARIALAWAIACGTAAAGPVSFDPETVDTGAGNLLAVLRESAGENKLDEALRPYGPLQATTLEGQRVEFETSWYRYLGDMHIRLVFDGPRTLQSASPDDLSRLQLTPEEALRLAVANLRRVYGVPRVQPWSGGLIQVTAAAPELTSSYFLDREFWQALQTGDPDGLVVAVPRRGGLVYAPAGDAQAVESLRFSAAALYAGGPGARLSSALYLFKDGRWSVFQAPQPMADQAP